MGDEAHVGLVDAHAEGDGGDDHDALLLEEALLVLRALGGLETGVIGQCGKPPRAEPRRRLLNRAAGAAIDDARIARVLALDEGEELRPRLALGHHPVADIGPVEARGEDARLAEREPHDDVAAGDAVGGRGEGNARHRRKALVEDGEGEILGPEVVAPLRDAMGLVDGEECYPRAREELKRARHGEPLRRDIEKVEAPLRERALDGAGLARRERGVERCRAHA